VYLLCSVNYGIKIFKFSIWLILVLLAQRNAIELHSRAWCCLLRYETHWARSHLYTMYIRVTLYWGYLMYCDYFVWCVSCSVVVLTCFVMCGWVHMGCFGNMCTCIYCVLYYLHCVFVLFRLCTFIFICFACASCKDYCYRVTTKLH